jgi:hypothetical protein
VVGKRREPERLALQTNKQKFEEVLQQMKTFLKGAMPIPADLIRGEMGGRGGWREGGGPCKARILYWGEKCSRFNAFSANSYSPK